MIILAIIAVLAILIMVVVPAVAATVARNTVSSIDRARSDSIDQSLVEARLGRIEEAIDAMALQIERLSEHQRTLLGADGSRSEEENRLRTEN